MSLSTPFTITEPVAHDGQHPVVKVPGTRMLIIGTIAASWWHRATMPEIGPLLSVDVHYDGDDPCHQFLTKDDFAPLPDAALLADAYNAPYKKAFRLVERRLTQPSRMIKDVWMASASAALWLDLARMIRERPGAISYVHPTGLCGIAYGH